MRVDVKWTWALVDRLLPCEFGGDCAYPYRLSCPHRKSFLGWRWL